MFGRGPVPVPRAEKREDHPSDTDSENGPQPLKAQTQAQVHAVDCLAGSHKRCTCVVFSRTLTLLCLTVVMGMGK